MVKNMRIELRVDEDERELWKAAAEKDGLSISAWLRQLARVETEVAPKMPEVREKPEVFRMVEERVAEAEVNDDKAFKKKVAQIMGRENVTQEQAETKARES